MKGSLTPAPRLFVVLALCPCLAAFVGCSGSGLSGPTGTVSGKVTYNGNPVPAGCTVTFVHDETSLAAAGQTGADGSYTLQMQGGGDVPAGAYKISVGPPAAAGGAGPDNPEAYAASMESGGDASADTGTPFPDKYLLPGTSGLTFTVKEGPNSYDVEMTD